MNVKWQGDVFGHVVVGGAILNTSLEVSKFLLVADDLSAEDARSLGRMCYFMCIREARGAGEGFVLQGADKWLDSLYTAGFPPAVQGAVDEFREQLFSLRTEPGYILLEHAFKNLLTP
jgi:hypothetical protein